MCTGKNDLPIKKIYEPQNKNNNNNNKIHNRAKCIWLATKEYKLLLILRL